MPIYFVSWMTEIEVTNNHLEKMKIEGLRIEKEYKTS